MSTFSTTHADILADINRNYASLYYHVGISEQMRIERDCLLCEKRELDNETARFDLLDINEPNLSETNREILTTAQPILTNALQMYNEGLKNVLSKLDENFESEIIIRKMKQTTRKIIKEINKIEASIKSLKFGSEDKIDVQTMFRISQDWELEYMTFHNITIDSTEESPLKIKLVTDRERKEYFHYISTITRGGKNIRNEYKYEINELIGINGCYIKQMNRSNVRTVLKDAIETGRVVFEFFDDRVMDKFKKTEPGQVEKTEEAVKPESRKDLTKNKYEAKIGVTLEELKIEVANSTALTTEDTTTDVIATKTQMNPSAESTKPALMIPEIAQVDKPVRESNEETNVAAPETTSLNENIGDEMSGFLNTHADMMEGIDESCKWLDNMYEKYEQMSGAIDHLTYLKKDVKRTAANVHSLNPKSEADREQLRKLEEAAKTVLDKFNASLKAASSILNALPDLTEATDKINEITPAIDEEIDQLNGSVVEFKLSQEVTVDAVKLYKSTNPDMAFKALDTLTLESTVNSPVVISLSSREERHYELDDEVYKHEINYITKGEAEFKDYQRPAGALFRDEILAINGQYLKELNKKEAKVVIETVIHPKIQYHDIEVETDQSAKHREFTRSLDFYDEFVVEVPAGCHTGLVLFPIKNEYSYTHIIDEVIEGSRLAYAVDVDLILKKELITVNGKYVKNINTLQVVEIIRDFCAVGGILLLGVLHEPFSIQVTGTHQKTELEKTELNKKIEEHKQFEEKMKMLKMIAQKQTELTAGSKNHHISITNTSAINTNEENPNSAIQEQQKIVDEELIDSDDSITGSEDSSRSDSDSSDSDSKYEAIEAKMVKNHATSQIAETVERQEHLEKTLNQSLHGKLDKTLEIRKINNECATKNEDLKSSDDKLSSDGSTTDSDSDESSTDDDSDDLESDPETTDNEDSADESDSTSSDEDSSDSDSDSSHLNDADNKSLEEVMAALRRRQQDGIKEDEKIQLEKQSSEPTITPATEPLFEKNAPVVPIVIATAPTVTMFVEKDQEIAKQDTVDAKNTKTTATESGFALAELLILVALIVNAVVLLYF